MLQPPLCSSQESAEQTALVGQAKTEINCLPVENAQYRQIMDERSRQALLKPRRETKMVDRNPEGNLFAPTIRHPGSFEVGFTVRNLLLDSGFNLICGD